MTTIYNKNDKETKQYDLKRCPHCRKWDTMSLIPIKTTGYKITCDYAKGGCGASGGMGKTPEEAIRMWNMRTPFDHLKHELSEKSLTGFNMNNTRCISSSEAIDLVDLEQEKFLTITV